MQYADVILPIAVPRPYTYALGVHALRAAVGMRVIVPVGKSATAVGVIERLHDTPPVNGKIREVEEIIDQTAVVTPNQMALWRWMSGYYMCSLGEVSKAALPRGIQYASYAPPRRSVRAKHTSADQEYVPQHAIAEHMEQLRQRSSTALLYGAIATLRVDLYIALIREAIAAGCQSLVIVPDHAEPLVDRLVEVFGSERILQYYGRQPEARRSKSYTALLESPEQFDIVIGTRTALFLPLHNLSQVIVDSEADSRYYQNDPAPRYHARDTALVLARIHGARALLAAQWPTLESYYNAVRGKYTNIYIPKTTLPPKTTALERGKGLISKYLHERITDNIRQERQVVLFQNRRGFSPYVECTQCSTIPQCSQCNVTLTYHKQNNTLECHYCGIAEPYNTQCPSCGVAALAPRGIGTERVEEQVRAMFPEAIVDRLDTDSASSRVKAGRILGEFSQHNTDILVGTQLLNRTARMGRIGLVGVINADNMLSHPDFRASERAYELLMQLSSLINMPDGEVVIQGSQRDSRVVRAVREDDMLGFYASELEERGVMLYPPMVRMLRLELRHADLQIVRAAASALYDMLHPLFGTRISIPYEPQIDRIMGQNLRQMLLRIERERSIERAKSLLATKISEFEKSFPKVRLIVAVDPL